MGNRDIWIFGGKLPVLKNKDLLIDTYIKRFFIRTSQMFEYKNLPETIPQRELELIIQFCRVAIFTKKEDKLFVFYGGLGGQPNEYYQPTQAIVSNPYLKFSSVLDLDDYIKSEKEVDAVIVWNDSAHMGMFPLFSQYAELLAECDLTTRYALINKRFMNILTADDDNTKTSIEDMFKQVDNGTGFGIIVTKNLVNELNVTGIDMGIKGSMDLKDINETKQYILGSFYNDIGLNANFNMKRESINESEADLNEDALLPLTDDMLQCRKIGVDAINKLFGTSIEVDYSSSWKKLREEIKQREELADAEIEELESIDEPQPSEESQPEEKVEEDGKD